MVTSSTSYPSNDAHSVVTDLTVCIFHTEVSRSPYAPTSGTWHRVEKELYQYESSQTRTAWLYVALKNEEELVPEDLLVMDITVGEPPPESGHSWERRPHGIWVLRSKFGGKIGQAVTAVDVLFGIDAVDPRPWWKLMRSSLQLDAQPKVPVARLSVLHGRVEARSGAREVLRVKENGKFRIVQISDTHMVTGVGVCKDAIDAQGKYLPECEADPRTIEFIRKSLDVETPDLVILTGDQLHHDISDSQSALFKVVDPIIKRSIPFAAVFGNHDSEGSHALSREAQMSILEELPFSLCQSGPVQVEGVGNFVLPVLARDSSKLPPLTLYLLDSHGQTRSEIQNPDYTPIKQSQIDWFTKTSEAQRKARAKDNNGFHISVVFQHIPLPEFGDPGLNIHNGHRREPTESPSSNTRFYDTLVEEGVAALGCGHDHVNDFCALRPQQNRQNGEKPAQSGPWLCYGGCSGFGGYCSYNDKRYHRRVRVWELDANTGSLTTWKRVEYGSDRVDELVLVDRGAVVDAFGNGIQGG